MKESKNIANTHTQWFKEVHQHITHTRLQTSITVNTALLQLYFDIGITILDVQERLGWGSQIIDKLAAFIKKEDPSSKGFSVRNLKYMRAFALAYPSFPNVQVPLAQILHNW